MKTLSVVVVFVMMLAGAFVYAAGQQSQTKPATEVCTLKVSGMTCAGCEAAVRMAVRSVKGVTGVKASSAKGNAEVTFDPSKTNPEAIAKAITDKSGFKAEPVRPASRKQSH